MSCQIHRLGIQIHQWVSNFGCISPVSVFRPIHGPLSQLSVSDGPIQNTCGIEFLCFRINEARSRQFVLTFCFFVFFCQFLWFLFGFVGVVVFWKIRGLSLVGLEPVDRWCRDMVPLNCSMTIKAWKYYGRVSSLR